jgi:hypothetical protein
MKIYKIASTTEPNRAVASLVSGEVSNCWLSRPLGERVYRWALALTPDSLIFRADLPFGRPDFDDSYQRGAFIEGLWDRDLAEFFIMDEAGRYQEFNVSPAGAWWSCYLTSYRQRSDLSINGQPSFVETQLNQAGWSVVFALPRSALLVPITEKSSVHVTAIASIAGERRFISSAPTSNFAPDFHRRECFQAVELA